MGIMDMFTGGGSLSSIFGGMFTVIVVILGGIVLIGLMIGIGWLMYEWFMKYNQFRCVIFQRNGFGQLEQKSDKGAIFVDRKTKNKRLWLKKNMVGLDPDNVPYISSGNKKIIYLLQTGLKNFRYISVKIAEPMVKLTVGEEDVNWAINAYERQKKLFQDSMWMQLMPYIIIAFVSIIILILFTKLFASLPVFETVAEAMKEVAKELARASSDTVIVDGVPL